MKRHARRLLAAMAMAWTLTLFSSFAAPAWADVQGPCTATIAGVDVNDADSPGDAVEVNEDSRVEVTMNALQGQRFSSHSISLEFAGFSREVSSGTDDSDRWSDTVNVDDYATYGVGLYKVKGSAILSPSGSCSGDAYVKVVGRSPLTTVAGIAAAGVTVVGAVGLAAAGAASALGPSNASIEKFVTDRMEEQALSPEELARRRAEEHDRQAFTGPGPYPQGAGIARALLPYCFFLVLPALILTGVAMVTEGGAPQGQPSRLGRVGWRPRISAVGVAAGLLAAIGIVVLLQQYAVVYPTLGVAIAGLGLGLAAGLIIPSVMRIFAVARVNQAIARAEERPRGGGQEPPAPGGQP